MADQCLESGDQRTLVRRPIDANDPKRTDLGLLQLWPNPRHLVVACLVLAVRWEMLKCAPPVGRALMAQASLR